MDYSIYSENMTDLMPFLDKYLEESIDEILTDSEIDPHYSAVCAKNFFYCCSKIYGYYNNTINPFINFETYMITKGFSKADYEIVEQKSIQEEPVYRSKIYYSYNERNNTSDLTEEIRENLLFLSDHLYSYFVNLICLVIDDNESFFSANAILSGLEAFLKLYNRITDVTEPLSVDSFLKSEFFSNREIRKFKKSALQL